MSSKRKPQRTHDEDTGNNPPSPLRKEDDRTPPVTPDTAHDQVCHYVGVCCRFVSKVT